MPPIRRRVREQYERYPYPPLRGRRERRFAPFGAMAYVQHVLWPGRRDLRGLRVLEAGCGTGNTVVAIAKRYPEIEVVGIDLSEASLDATRTRARWHGVGSNLTLRRLAVEDAGALDGPFDYVISSGVLHHLADPAAGLQVLAGLLAPTGGLGIMLYATYGRQSLSMLQQLLRRLVGTREVEEQVAFARSLLAAWPRRHPFKPGRYFDLRWTDDAGVVDMLLHVQERSYTVPEVLAFLAGAGLRLERFYDPPVYNPSSYMTRPDVASALAALPHGERAAAAELLHGQMMKHLFFATRDTHTPPRAEPRGLFLLHQRPRRSPLFDWEPAGRRSVGAAPLAVREHAFDFQVRTCKLDEWSARAVAYCDGERTAWQIFQLPDVNAAIPGATAREKLQLYGAYMEHLADQMVLLFER